MPNREDASGSMEMAREMTGSSYRSFSHSESSSLHTSSHPNSGSGSGSGYNDPLNRSNRSTASSNRGKGGKGGGGVPEHIFAHKETKNVRYTRNIVLTVFLSSAIVAGIVTWWLVDTSQQTTFETKFRTLADTIRDISRHNAGKIFTIVEGLSKSMTTSALTLNQTWPNVTIDHFEIKGGRFRDVTQAQLVSMAPIITDINSWNAYANTHQDWIAESYHYKNGNSNSNQTSSFDPIPEELYRYENDNDGTTTSTTDSRNGNPIPEVQQDFTEYCPLWQESTAPSDTSILNFNLLSDDIFARVFSVMKYSKEPVLSEVFDPSNILGSVALLETDDEEFHPESILVQPIFDTFEDESKTIVGTVIVVIPWDVYFNELLHDGANGIVCVLRDTCGDVFSYEVNGPTSKYLGAGDLHSTEYNWLEETVPFGPNIQYEYLNKEQEESHCKYSLRIYPSEVLENEYRNKEPMIYSLIMVLIFLFACAIFLAYDYLVDKRQAKVHSAAVKSNAIVSSLFPAEIRDRLFQHNESTAESPIAAGNDDDGGGGGGSAFLKKDGDQQQPASTSRLTHYLKRKRAVDTAVSDVVSSVQDYNPHKTRPIADLFPNTTVMFADIAGFTAWSSVREPSQVFTLLETLYRAFDIIANRREVFKVETVGDCYVAVTGLPEPRKDHAVMMARFARDCMARMDELSHRLEVTLGPDTGDLAMRFGLHSGQVTAGVLRGDKSRFQLFGDTVNTAARIESTGLRSRIHLSQDTADLLCEAGKESWIVPREDVVVAKGKGEMQTYWLLTKEGTIASGESKDGGEEKTEEDFEGEGHHDDVIPEQTKQSAKISRLVDWNVDVLKRILKLILAKRAAQRTFIDPDELIAQKDVVKETEDAILTRDGMALDEVVEIVTLPKFDARTHRSQLDPASIQIPDHIVSQLRGFVESIAYMYRENPFHNFEHASHVTMSVSKLLSRIVAPDIDHHDGDVASTLHDHTYGITSDPLTQLAVVIAALIHDVDHVGVANFVLIEENPALAETYRNKSIAEQNSVDLAWETLMEPRYSELRNVIYDDETELNRFRQLVVNAVLATDIFDKELSALRKDRWAKAFSEDEEQVLSDKQVAVNRKATIVIEHLVQASDVAHTMQHWHIYQKWNERLFKEMYDAYKNGRTTKNSSIGWYQGELWFFDNYIIPLAKKLKECGVFGVSSEEYLNYAVENRREWASKGEEVVASMIQKYCDPEDNPGDGSTATESKSDSSKSDKATNSS